MDYLHGDVETKEAWFACRYEYARESPQLWRAAEERVRRRQTRRGLSCEQAALAIVEEKLSEWETPDMPTLSFLSCESFPKKDWNELLPVERKGIALYDTRLVRPLSMPDVWVMRRKFKEVAKATQPPCVAAVPGLPPRAMLCKSDSVYWCLFTVDFSARPKPLAQRFTAWLNQPEIRQLWREHKRHRTKEADRPIQGGKSRQQGRAAPLYWCLFEVDLSARKQDLVRQFSKWLVGPENRQRLNRHAQQKRGKTGDLLDRLKDLAAWRIYRENGNNCEQANLFADRHRKAKAVTVKRGEPPQRIARPFFNARSQDCRPAHQADLFFCDEDYRHAKARALDRLADWLPCEFKQPGQLGAWDREYLRSFRAR
jgi:truncated hemoglobin YjbI